MRAPRATTRVAGVIGHPVRHSLSPVLHNAAFSALGLDWVYVAFDVRPGEAAGALAAMRALGIDGLSVTMPHKTDVARLVDELTPEARRLDAVNTVVSRAGALVGHNTDGAGFVDSLAAAGVGIAGASVVVLGAGGAARAVIAALATAGAEEVVVVNRTPAKAEQAAELAGARGRVGSLDDVAPAGIVVNATSVGMGTAELPLDPSSLHAGQVVADLVYQPLETALLVEARRRGARAVDGLGMLIHQAARAFALWTGQPAPVDVMRAAAEAALGEAARPSGRPGL